MLISSGGVCLVADIVPEESKPKTLFAGSAWRN
jgi:hypothetical protein